MRTILISALILSGFALSAQQPVPHRSATLHFAKAATIDLKNLHTEWDPQLQWMEMPAPGSDGYRRYLIDLKEKLYGDYVPSGEARSTESGDVPMPAMLGGWEGNAMGSSVPNDNDLAISNGGKIISVINQSIYIYDETDSLYQTLSLYAFSDTLGILSSRFDPKVVYDPVADRFIIVCLNGFTPETSLIIIGFSQTNDPTGAWNLYALPGNPKNNDRWTDFPMMAITQNELFITGNLIIPDEPWQTGFSETLIWQMSLDNGYAGDSLDAVYYDSVYFGGAPIRNLNPVKGGAATYGPDMYFLSDRNFAPSNDTIFIVHVTGTLDDPGTSVTVDFSRADLAYGVPPQARQYGTHIFDTNDGRILGSFMEDGKIQFVANSLDPSTGFCGIYHGIISDLGGTNSIHAHIIGDDTLDLGYPNISYTGHWDGDDQSIITCDHTAPTVYAGMSAVYYNYDTYSDLVDIKTGDTYVNVLSGSYERWGDYTGSQTKFNEPGTIWVSGNFGKLIETWPITSRNNATWIAKLQSTDEHPQAISEITTNASASVYPNPSDNYFTTEFTLPHSGNIQIRLYDMNGQLVKYIYDTEAHKGLNKFSFSTAPLVPGNYLLDIRLKGKPFSSLMVVKE